MRFASQLKCLRRGEPTPGEAAFALAVLHLPLEPPHCDRRLAVR